MNILVLGANGMLGRVVYTYLKKKHPQSVWGTALNDTSFLRFDAKDPVQSFSSLTKQIGTIDYIINCIGVLKNYPDLKNRSSKDFILVNSLLPHLLAEIAEKNNSRLLHVSTDAVFSPNAGVVNEEDTPAAMDQYSCSKLLGEPNSAQAITFRTSIIGFDPVKKRGLLESLLLKKSSTVEGYINQKWSGSTVLQFAKLCNWLISNQKFDSLRSNSSVYHFSPIGPTSKYELVKEFFKTSGYDVNVIQKEGSEVSRVMESKYNNELELSNYSNDIKIALEELIAFEKTID